MSIDKTYKCDLCREKSSKLTGIYWISLPMGFIEEDVTKAEHHLCHNCLASAASIWEAHQPVAVEATTEEEGK